MGVIRFDGWEHGVVPASTAGNFYDGIGTGQSVVTTPTPPYGTRCLRCNPSSNQAFVAWLLTDASRTRIAGQFRFRFATGPPGSVVIARWVANSGQRLYFHLGLSGGFNLFLQSDNAAGGVNNSPNVPTVSNTWYRIGFDVDVSTSPWGVAWRIDGVDQTPPTQTHAVAVANEFDLGNIDSTDSVDLFYDDFVLFDSGTEYAAGTEYAVLGYSPNAVATHSFDAATSGYFFKEISAVDSALTTSETTSYQTIDDVPLDADNDAIFVQPGAGSPATPTLRAWGAATYSANNVANGNIATAAPAGKAVGDGLILIVASTSNAFTVTTPSGWTLVTPARASGTAVGGKIFVYTRTADGTAADTPTVVVAGLTTGTTGTPAVTLIGAYQNLDVTLDAISATVADTTATTTTTIPATTTTVDKSLVLGIALKMQDAAQTSTVATFTERVDSSTTNAIGFAIEVSDLVKTPAGSSGTAAVTWSSATSARTFALSIAIKATTTPVQPTATWYSEFGFADEATLTAAPVAVNAYVVANLDTASSSTWVAKVFDSVQGTNVEDVYNATVTAAAKSYRAAILRQRPNTGGVWTIAALNGLRLRFGYTAAATGHPRLESAMVEALHTVPAAAAPARPKPTVVLQAVARAVTR